MRIAALLVSLSLSLSLLPLPVSAEDPGLSERTKKMEGAAAQLKDRFTTEREIDEAQKLVNELEPQKDLTEKEREVLGLLKNMIQVGREKLLGVRQSMKIGEWNVRVGELSREGCKHFGMDLSSYGTKFSYATYTVEGGWTLGVRHFVPRYPDNDSPKPLPQYYLQGPAALEPKKVVRFSRCTDTLFYPQEAWASPDGTIPLGAGFPFPGAARTVTYRFGKERVVTFNLQNANEVFEAVEKQTLPQKEKPKPPAEPAPKPPPR